jgi:hypothetical protein
MDPRLHPHRKCDGTRKRARSSATWIKRLFTTRVRSSGSSYLGPKVGIPSQEVFMSALNFPSFSSTRGASYVWTQGTCISHPHATRMVNRMLFWPCSQGHSGLVPDGFLFTSFQIVVWVDCQLLLHSAYICHAMPGNCFGVSMRKNRRGERGTDPLVAFGRSEL